MTASTATPSPEIHNSIINKPLKATMKYRLIATLFVAALTTGCATQTTSIADSNCVRAEIRQEGMLVNKDRCTAWEFGPSRRSVAAFTAKQKGTSFESELVKAMEKQQSSGN